MEKDFQELYSTLKKLGFLMESKLNEQIQKGLNKKDLMKWFHHKSHEKAKLLRCLKNQIEEIANLVNIPTKEDVVNVAHLVKQNEEKIDELKEQIRKICQHLDIKDGKRFCRKKASSKTKKEEKLKVQDEKKLKKLLLLHMLMESSSKFLAKKE